MKGPKHDPATCPTCLARAMGDLAVPGDVARLNVAMRQATGSGVSVATFATFIADALSEFSHNAPNRQAFIEAVHRMALTYAGLDAELEVDRSRMH